MGKIKSGKSPRNPSGHIQEARLVHGLEPCWNLGLILVIYTMRELAKETTEGPLSGLGCSFAGVRVSSPAAQQRPLAARGGSSSSRRRATPGRFVKFLPDLRDTEPGRGPLTNAPCRGDCVYIQDANSSPRARRILPLLSFLYPSCNFHYKTTALGPRGRRPNSS